MAGRASAVAASIRRPSSARRSRCRCGGSCRRSCAIRCARCRRRSTSSRWSCSASAAHGIVWVTDPALVERILLHEHETFPKTPLEKRVLGPTLGDGILTAEGPSWRWQRRIAAPLFRHQDLLALRARHDRAAAEAQIARWRPRADRRRSRPIERDMTDATYDVVTRTLFAGAAAAEGDDRSRRASAALLDVISWEIAAAMLQAPAWLWHPGKSPLRRNAALHARRVVGDIVARRRREGGDRRRPDRPPAGRARSRDRRSRCRTSRSSTTC